MREVQKFISKVAPSDSTVLIHGETGTGKELVARAIHRGSPRAERPFVAINCAALTETLLESELFGHERGAFTGAIAQKIGKLEAAEGGTLFLDEIGELPAPLQPKLLRALQEREFERVGGTKSVRVDIRMIAATNIDLKRAVADGRFRQDLFYRLNVVSIKMPALRNHRDDIPLLSNYFISRPMRQAGRRIAGISPEAMVCLLGYDWPGNVRELENAIEHAAVLGSTELILVEDLPESVLDGSTAAAEPESFHEAVRRHKKELILTAVEQAHGNCTEAARVLGLHPNYLHRLITALRLRHAIRRGAG
jgi:Nif-specific regulatory protein